jgi:hypothetical protein
VNVFTVAAGLCRKWRLGYKETWCFAKRFHRRVTAMCHKIPLRAPLTLLLAISSLPALAADDEEETASLDRTPQDCISTTRIRDTDVVNDSTIVFEMRGGLYFSNILERDCPGLMQHSRFRHRSTNTRLCDIDTITVLEQWGGGFTDGFTCQLGAFHPITEVEAEDLISGPDEAAAIENDIEIKDVELPPDENEPEPDPEPDAEP